MYASLRQPWSQIPGKAERLYKSQGLVKTQGTVFVLPPRNEVLKKAFNAPPRPKSRMSAGAVALCKHFERGGSSSEHGRPHPFWTLPKGSNDHKSMLAAQILDEMLEDAQWRNVMLLHLGVAVYEIRNSRGYGMRWTLQLEEQFDSPIILDPDDGVISAGSNRIEMAPADNEDERPAGGTQWSTTNTSFRGFLEPIVGLDHEVLALS